MSRRHHYRRTPAGSASMPALAPPPGREAAACRGEDTEIFFDAAAEPHAKLLCAQCPVRADCLEYAITTPERYGTWGGLNEDERASERRRRQRRDRAAETAA